MTSGFIITGLIVAYVLRLKHYNRLLSESEERFRQLAGNIQEVFWMANPRERRVVYVNPAFEKIYGRTPDEVYADTQALFDTVHPDDRSLLEACIADQAEGKRTQAQYRILAPDGSIRWVRDRGFPVIDTGVRGSGGNEPGWCPILYPNRGIPECDCCHCKGREPWQNL